MTIRTLVLLALFFVPVTTLAAGEEPPALPDLDVLVVSPAAAEGDGKWVVTLLAAHGARATLAGWDAVAGGIPDGIDLVVLTGPSRRAGNEVRLDLDAPVLGIGPYGHSCFGRIRLKHGSPFS
jgi:hypothetical protein